jgi:osmotically-inducible protein OsmY
MASGYSRSRGRLGGRSYGGYGTTGDYSYGAEGEYGQSQFGGAAEGDTRDSQSRQLTPEEYWQRYFAGGAARTRGEDTADRFVPAEARRGDARPAHRTAGPSRHPLAPEAAQRTDTQLYEDLCEALLRHEELDCSEVTVAVHGGEVMLEGSVPARSMRYRIEDLAAGHPAVREVHNRITVRND